MNPLDPGQIDAESLDDLFPLVYDELRKLARHHLAAESKGHTLPATALVHELYLRLAAQRQDAWRNRAHFFAIAARLLRRILVDYARRKGAGKRGGARARVPLLDDHMVVAAEPEELLTLNGAIEDLAARDPGQARMVDLHYFMGMTAEEIGALLGSDPQEIYAEMRIAKAWLKRKLGA
jgi:RNA polymerase sigma-70 factor, ECF subfamily